MAQSVKSLHKAFKNGANVVDSEFLTDINAERRDMYLNRAIDWVLHELAVNYGKGGYYDDQIAQIVVTDKQLETSKGTDYVIAKRPSDQLRMLRVSAMVEHVDGCCDPEEAIVVIKSPDMIAEALRGNFTRPDWRYRQTVAMRTSEGVKVYNGHNLVVNDVKIDYIRDIPSVYAPSEMEGTYKDEDGRTRGVDVDLELDSPFVKAQVEELAVLYALNDAKRLAEFQSQFREMIQKPEAIIR